MTALAILTDALQRIPSWLRKTLLVLFALVVVAEQVARILEVDLAYAKVDQVLALVGGYLGIQSAANVAPAVKVEAVNEERLVELLRTRDQPLPFGED
jgi:hypothetical protein